MNKQNKLQFPLYRLWTTNKPFEITYFYNYLQIRLSLSKGYNNTVEG